MTKKKIRFLDQPLGGTAWAEIKDDGAVEVWGRSISSHPWKERVYPAQLVEVISLPELKERLRAQARAYPLARKEKRAREERQAKRKEWAASLPDEIDGFVIDKTRLEVFDDLGNFLFPLPSEPMTLNELKQWLQKEWEEFLEYEG